MSFSSRSAVNSAPDPCVLLSQAPNNQETYDYSGRTQASATLTAGTVNFIIWGDSLAGANDNVSYTPTNLPNVRDLSLQNGGVYQSKSPVIGSTVAIPANNGFWGHRFADKLINGGKASVVNIVNMSIGASATGDWAALRLNYKFRVAYARMKSLGWLAAPTFILSSIGGADQQVPVAQATVLANLNALIAAVRGYGFATTPMYFALSSWANGTGGSNGLAVRAAIASAISGNANCFTGADTDTLGSSYKYDNNHWNATGSDADAQLWYNIFAPLLPQ